MGVQKSDKIWFDGQLVPWDQATVHVAAHVLHYGSSVFEGIRTYEVSKRPAIFCLDPHIDRLFNSAKVFRMQIPYTQQEIKQAIVDTVVANRHKACYIRPLIFRGLGSLGVNPQNCLVHTVIITMEWGRYLGPEAIEQGVDVGVSSWQRMAPNTLPAAVKLGGQYINSQLVVMEAVRHGYAEGIVLDASGFVSEGSGENIFIIDKGNILTPPLASSILQGVTRHCVITLAEELGYHVREERIPRELLYLADEVFFTGTAAEITPIRSIDGISIGSGRRGPITERLQTEFFGITNGQIPDRHGWLTPIRV
ncbi:MAG: branched-chain amino acid transaminase [Chloroflexi bacterium]|nr:branched-chain amino acid transaminase [Chloroflexota bacterium]